MPKRGGEREVRRGALSLSLSFCRRLHGVNNSTAYSKWNALVFCWGREREERERESVALPSPVRRPHIKAKVSFLPLALTSSLLSFHSAFCLTPSPSLPCVVSPLSFELSLMTDPIPQQATSALISQHMERGERERERERERIDMALDLWEIPPLIDIPGIEIACAGNSNQIEIPIRLSLSHCVFFPYSMWYIWYWM